jgi:predicted ATPase/transcriptional regulator with XRE-family HTH domain
MQFNGLFGTWLKVRRKALDLTQQDLADQVGYSVVTIRKIESGVLRPSKDSVERFADVLAISDEERPHFLEFARQRDVSLSIPSNGAKVRSPTSHLPVQPTPFVGKASELQQIATYLSDPNCRLLTLVGVGGSGKTRLALQTAEEAHNDFADGCHFVPLIPIDTPELIPAAVADALNFSFLATDDPKAQILHYLREKQMLLVMDNFEHLLEGSLLVSDLLGHAPQVKVIATTRERLSLQEEWLLPVAGMSYPDTSADEDRFDAVDLFIQNARRVQPGFSLDDNRDSVFEICRAVEGLPLALELSAAWLHMMPIEEVAISVQREANFLTTSLRNVPERHRSMSALFDQSWQFLTGTEQHSLARLSVFPGSFDRLAAEQVAGASLAVLAVLADKSLLRMQPSGRYELHSLIRQYAAERLEQTGRSQSAQFAHAAYYAHYMHEREHSIYGKDQLRVMREVEAEWDNIRHAWNWIVAQRDFELLDLILETVYYYALQFRVAELREFWKHAIEGFAPTGELQRHIAWGRLLSRSLFVIGVKGNQQDLSVETMQDYIGQAISIATAYGRLDEIAYAYWSMGWYWHWFNLDGNDALQNYQRALSLYEQIGNTYHIAHTNGRLGAYLWVRGDTKRGAELLWQALAQFRQVENEFEAGWILFDLSFLSLLCGRVRDADTYYHEAMAIHRLFGSPFVCGVADLCLAFIAILRGDLYEAVQNADRALSLLGNETDYWSHLQTKGIVAAIRCLSGNFDQALSMIHLASDDPQETQIYNPTSFIHNWAKALVHLSLAEYEQAQFQAGISRTFHHPTLQLPPITFLPFNAALLAHGKKYVSAAQLLAHCDTYSSDIMGWTKLWKPFQKLRTDLLNALGGEGFDAAYADGQAMTLEQAIALWSKHSTP